VAGYRRMRVRGSARGGGVRSGRERCWVGPRALAGCGASLHLAAEGHVMVKEPYR